MAFQRGRRLSKSQPPASRHRVKPDTLPVATTDQYTRLRAENYYLRSILLAIANGTPDPRALASTALDGVR